MSKKGYISRYLLILKRLKLKPYSSFEDLQDYIDNQFDFLQMQDHTLNIGFSKRTLQRDIREINNIFGIDIEYSKPNKGYYISQSETENMNFQRMIEAFDMFNSLNLVQGLEPYIYLEKRRPEGSDNLYGLLHAIKNRLQITFAYQKFWEDEVTSREADPLALKEFKNRWYLLAKDYGDERIKTFALDRLTDLEIKSKRFAYPQNYDIEANFRYSFGIISPSGEEPTDVLLSFEPVQGKYIKSLPLHSSQQVLVDNEEELQISLKLFLTHDFIMELLSYGDNVKVLQPESLISTIRSAHENAFTQYK